jgi:hypothetical protein
LFDIESLKKDAIFKVRYELKYLFSGFLLTAAVSTFFIYLIIYLIDIEKTNKYNSLITLIFLGICTGISILLIITNSEKIEIRKFKSVLIGIFFWFLGETTYMFQQSILNISVPYPSIAELFYFIGYGFLIYHIYKSFTIANEHKSISRNIIILVSIIVSLIPIITTIHMIIDGIDIISQSLEITINLVYYTLDTILLVLALLVIYKLPKKDPFIYHWMLFCISMALLTIADFGYTYTSTISYDLILVTEWLWNLIYAFAYLFLSAALIWYYKLNQLLSNDLDHTFNIDESNRQIISNKGNFKEFVEEGNKQFIENTEDTNKIHSLLFELIKHSKSEIRILLSTPNWLEIQEIKNLLNSLNKRANEGILIRILLNVSIIPNGKNLPSSNFIFSNPKIHLRYFEKILTTDAMITIVDLQKAMVLDIKNENNLSDDKNKYFATYTNKEESVYTYLSSFEKIWLLEKVIKCNLQ